MRTSSPPRCADLCARTQARTEGPPQTLSPKPQTLNLKPATRTPNPCCYVCLSVFVFVVCLSVHVSACTVHPKWWRYWFVNALLLGVSVCVCLCLSVSSYVCLSKLLCVSVCVCLCLSVCCNVCLCQCLHGTSKVVAVLVRDRHADGPFSYGYGRCPVLLEYAGAALLTLVTCSF